MGNVDLLDLMSSRIHLSSSADASMPISKPLSYPFSSTSSVYPSQTTNFRISKIAIMDGRTHALSQQQHHQQTAVSPNTVAHWSPCSSKDTVITTTSPKTTTSKFDFPFRLHEMLNHVSHNPRSDEDLNHISWMPDGRSFKILDTTKFAARTLPKFFPKIQYKSFIRQLNIYGFNRVKNRSSPKYGEYSHEHFKRGEPDLCKYMTRQKIKGTGTPRSTTKKRELLSWDPYGKNAVSTPSNAVVKPLKKPKSSRAPNRVQPPGTFVPPIEPSAPPLPVSSGKEEIPFTFIPDEFFHHGFFSPHNIFGDESLEPLPL
ncbi:HSF-type DNA-binding protein [Nitzschia inconspicua]|uniref:HSF-type DNA-binding protein n=1 Tax=Nitzschia inconspicua TaxID=303405 RepID=A0A9K3PGD8_9STRA|nr:HSF-type DNA-binding protein [Nitzschia inconspicua]